MAWQSSITSGLTWNYINSGMTRTIAGSTVSHSLWYIDSNRIYSPNKNYQFITSIDNFRRNETFTFSKFLEINSPWGSTFSYSTASTALSDTRPNIVTPHDIVWFSKPNSIISSSERVEYKSTYNGFGNPLSDADGIPLITAFKVVEIDWYFQGWALSADTGYRGWSYNDANNSISWRNNIPSGFPRQPVGGFTQSNYATRYISYPKFNLEFNILITLSDFVDLYLVNNISDFDNNPNFLNNLQDVNKSQFIGRINGPQSGTDYSFYNLTGEKWLLINGRYTTSQNTVATLSDFNISGSYQENDNNSQFLFTNSDIFYEPTTLSIIGGSSDATYSTITVTDNTLHNPTSSSFFGPTGSPEFFSSLYGDVINLSQLNSKVGNGTFRAGIWENGVWNSGWRVDDQLYEFDDVLFSIQVNTMNNKWRIQISGNIQSTSNFEIGDKISIGNIVGIDVNENRKIIKNVFTIINKDTTNIVVEFSNSFPLRRIERDSENHKIKITKNVWLNGAFFNGYFQGIWNNGLFKGFPYITEMYNTHWIDGYYDGGHYYSEYPEWTYVDTYYWSNNPPNTLGLTFGAIEHGLVVGDKVIIDKDDKNINPQYDGEAEVVAVIDEHLVILNKVFGASSINEGGIIRRKTGTGVIQNFRFNDNNVAKKTTKDTVNLQEVYSYNSWIDVKYLTQSASNLNRQQISYQSSLNFEYSELNLYGFITKDILASESIFRNSWSLQKSKYSLGTKYKIYQDFLGEISEFNEPFSTSNSMDNFYNNGWTLSITAGYTISRTPDETLEIESNTFGINKLDNTNINIEKRRYSLIEFDLVNFQSTDDELSGFPSIHFYNNTIIPGNTQSKTAFPISEYVYHTRTEDLKKREYFYNRTTLDLFLITLGFTASFDNIKFYEVDMIPFFQYLNEEYVNKSIQVPYQGIAPQIDYNDSGFSFIDNIDIQLDSLSTQQTFTTPVSIDKGFDRISIK